MSTDSRDRLLAALDGATVEDLEELASHAEAMQQLRDAKLAGRLPENQTDAMAAMATRRPSSSKATSRRGSGRASSLWIGVEC